MRNWPESPNDITATEKRVPTTVLASTLKRGDLFYWTYNAKRYYGMVGAVALGLGPQKNHYIAFETGNYFGPDTPVTPFSGSITITNEKGTQ